MVLLQAAKDKSIALLRQFRQDRTGNVLMFFGFAMIPAIGLAGAAIDYARATTVRAQLHAAVDSAALMAARDAAKLSDADLKLRINGWIKATLSPDEAAKFTGATIGIDRTARTVTIAANVPVEKTVFRVIDRSDMQVASNSQSTWGTNKIELALALDNTGSMSSSGKMAALKTASLDLIKIMKDATTETGQIKISIVPFTTQVRLPTSYKSETWLRFDVKGKVYSYDSRGRTVTTMTNLANKNEWPGCISDRDKSYDTTDGDASGANVTLYPATFCDQVTGVGKAAPPVLAMVQPLTDNWTTLNNVVNSMTPNGNTNVTIGAAWGMATLSPAVPFTEAQPANTPRLNKYMILLTDGDNTENRFGDGESTIDDRTSKACTAAKTAGIKVYTIRVINGNSTLLRNCATTTSMFYEVTSAAQLSPIFKQIASEISQVRLTQ